MITSRLTGTRKTLPKGAKMVLQELSEAREIVSAKELAFRMKLKSPVAAPGLTTVYRSLELLTRLGLVQELVRNEEKQYEMVRPGEKQHHLVCKSCNQHTRMSNTAKNGSGQILKEKLLEEEIYRDYGFAVSNHVLEIFGTCRQCNDKQPHKLNAAQNFEHLSSR